MKLYISMRLAIVLTDIVRELWPPVRVKLRTSNPLFCEDKHRALSGLITQSRNAQLVRFQSLATTKETMSLRIVSMPLIWYRETSQLVGAGNSRDKSGETDRFFGGLAER